MQDNKQNFKKASNTFEPKYAYVGLFLFTLTMCYFLTTLISKIKVLFKNVRDPESA